MEQQRQQQSRDKVCPECGAEEIQFDETYGFYKCDRCDHCWGYPEDDPDYEECEDEEAFYLHLIWDEG